MSLPSNISTYITITMKIGVFQGGETGLNSSLWWFSHHIITFICSQSYFWGLVCNQRECVLTQILTCICVNILRESCNYCQGSEGTPSTSCPCLDPWDFPLPAQVPGSNLRPPGPSAPAPWLPALHSPVFPGHGTPASGAPAGPCFTLAVGWPFPTTLCSLCSHPGSVFEPRSWP